MLNIEDDVMRQHDRSLNSAETATRQAVKQYGQSFYDLLTRIGESRELSLAKTKIEEAVMWATKHITRGMALPVIDPHVELEVEHQGAINLKLMWKMLHELKFRDFGTSLLFFSHPDLEPDVRDVSGFVPAEYPGDKKKYHESIGGVDGVECVVCPGHGKCNNGTYRVSMIGYHPQGKQMVVTALVTANEFEPNPFFQMPSQADGQEKQHGTV